MKKNIILAFHPDFQKSVTIKKIIDEIALKVKNTDIIWIQDDVKDFQVDFWKEKLNQYETFIFAFPYWWYSVPWNMKKWLDNLLWPLRLERQHQYSYITSAGVTIEKQSKLDIHKSLTHLRFTINYWVSKGDYKNESNFIKPIVVSSPFDQKKIDEAVSDYLKRFDQ